MPSVAAKEYVHKLPHAIVILQYFLNSEGSHCRDMARYIPRTWEYLQRISVYLHIYACPILFAFPDVKYLIVIQIVENQYGYIAEPWTIISILVDMIEVNVLAYEM